MNSDSEQNFSVIVFSRLKNKIKAKKNHEERVYLTRLLNVVQAAVPQLVMIVWVLTCLVVMFSMIVLISQKDHVRDRGMTVSGATTRMQSQKLFSVLIEMNIPSSWTGLRLWAQSRKTDI